MNFAASSAAADRVGQRLSSIHVRRIDIGHEVVFSVIEILAGLPPFGAVMTGASFTAFTVIAGRIGSAREGGNAAIGRSVHLRARGAGALIPRTECDAVRHRAVEVGGRLEIEPGAAVGFEQQRTCAC